MTICIFFRDILGPEIAIILESRNMVDLIKKEAEVSVIGKNQTENNLIEGVQCHPYRRWREIITLLRRHKKAKVDMLIVQAPLTMDGIWTIAVASFLRLPLYIQPFGQITTSAFGRQLFTDDPDIRTLESGLKQPEEKVQNYWKHRISCAKKQLNLIFLRLLKKSFISGWLTISSFSKRELKSLLSVKEEDCLNIPWVATPRTIGTSPERNWFVQSGHEIEVFRFVFWSRVDFWMKGVDRMLEGFFEAGKRDSDFRKNARLYMIGPSYQGGGEEALTHVSKLKLNGKAHWIPPGEYPSGSLAPLASADASLLFSRWDGFPRAIRESLELGVPFVVSEETHFEDVATEFDCGEVVDNADDPKSIAIALIKMYRYGGRQEMEKQSLKAFESLCSKNLSKILLPKLQSNAEA